MHASLRSQIDPVHLEKVLHVDTSQQGKHSNKDGTTAHSVTVNTKEKPMTILYGSNRGTCEGLAQSLAGVAGQQVDNAAHFLNWLGSLEAQKMLDSVNYAVYRYGNRMSHCSKHFSIRANICRRLGFNLS